MINISEKSNGDQMEMIQGDQSGMIQGAQVTSHVDRILGDRIRNYKLQELKLRQCTPPTNKVYTIEPNSHSHFQRDNTVLSTAPRVGKVQGRLRDPSTSTLSIKIPGHNSKPSTHYQQPPPPKKRTTNISTSLQDLNLNKS